MNRGKECLEARPGSGSLSVKALSVRHQAKESMTLPPRDGQTYSLSPRAGRRGQIFSKYLALSQSVTAALNSRISFRAVRV